MSASKEFESKFDKLKNDPKFKQRLLKLIEDKERLDDHIQKVRDKFKEQLNTLFGVKATQYKLFKPTETLGGTRYLTFAVNAEDVKLLHKMDIHEGMNSTIYWGDENKVKGILKLVYDIPSMSHILKKNLEKGLALAFKLDQGEVELWTHFK